MITTGSLQALEHHVDIRGNFIYRNSHNLELKRPYQVYCKILSNVIKEEKRIYDKNIQKSSNKGKTTCDIIKKLTSNQHSRTDIQELTKNS